VVAVSCICLFILPLTLMGTVAVYVLTVYSYSVGSSELYLPVCYLGADSDGDCGCVHAYSIFLFCR
jgi:hypothetical protein